MTHERVAEGFIRPSQSCYIGRLFANSATGVPNSFQSWRISVRWGNVFHSRHWSGWWQLNHVMFGNNAKTKCFYEFVWVASELKRNIPNKFFFHHNIQFCRKYLGLVVYEGYSSEAGLKDWFFSRSRVICLITPPKKRALNKILQGMSLHVEESISMTTSQTQLFMDFMNL